jgi:hypothetical protein
MTTIAELGTFLAREQTAATPALIPNGGSSAAGTPAAEGPPRTPPRRT